MALLSLLSSGKSSWYKPRRVIIIFQGLYIAEHSQYFILILRNDFCFLFLRFA